MCPGRDIVQYVARTSERVEVRTDDVQSRKVLDGSAPVVSTSKHCTSSADCIETRVTLKITLPIESLGSSRNSSR